MATAVVKAQALKRLPTPSLARAIREQARVSQVDVAADLKVHPTTVARWEAGVRRPRGELLVRYVELLDELREVAR